jgi:hypothetical protein
MIKWRSKMAKRFWEYPLPVGYDEYAISARTIMLNYRLRCAGLIQEREELLVSSIMKLVDGDKPLPKAKLRETVAPVRAALGL